MSSSAAGYVSSSEVCMSAGDRGHGRSAVVLRGSHGIIGVRVRACGHVARLSGYGGLLLTPRGLEGAGMAWVSSSRPCPAVLDRRA